MRLCRDPNITGINEDYRRRHREILVDAEARLLDLAIEHVSQLKDDLDVCDDLGGKISHDEMNDMTDEARTYSHRGGRRRCPPFKRSPASPMVTGGPVRETGMRGPHAATTMVAPGVTTEETGETKTTTTTVVRRAAGTDATEGETSTEATETIETEQTTTKMTTTTTATTGEIDATTPETTTPLEGTLTPPIPPETTVGEGEDDVGQTGVPMTTTATGEILQYGVVS